MRAPTDTRSYAVSACSPWSMPVTSTSSGIRQPIVALRAMAMTSVTTPEMTMVHRAIRIWMTSWSMPPP